MSALEELDAAVAARVLAWDAYGTPEEIDIWHELFRDTLEVIAKDRYEASAALLRRGSAKHRWIYGRCYVTVARGKEEALLYEKCHQPFHPRRRFYDAWSATDALMEVAKICEANDTTKQHVAAIYAELRSAAWFAKINRLSAQTVISGARLGVALR